MIVAHIRIWVYDSIHIDLGGLSGKIGPHLKNNNNNNNSDLYSAYILTLVCDKISYHPVRHLFKTICGLISSFPVWYARQIRICRPLLRPTSLLFPRHFDVMTWLLSVYRQTDWHQRKRWPSNQNVTTKNEKLCDNLMLEKAIDRKIASNKGS